MDDNYKQDLYYCDHKTYKFRVGLIVSFLLFDSYTRCKCRHSLPKPPPNTPVGHVFDTYSDNDTGLGSDDEFDSDCYQGDEEYYRAY